MIDTKDLIDVCGGKMKLDKVKDEIARYITTKKPTRLIVDIELRKDGYYTTIYLKKDEF